MIEQVLSANWLNSVLREEARADKTIGHSLNAKVTLFADEESEDYKLIENNLELLQTVFIVSGLELKVDERKDSKEVNVVVSVAEGEKCERCWKYDKTVGENHKHPTLCSRCVEAIS